MAGKPFQEDSEGPIIPQEQPLFPQHAVRGDMAVVISMFNQVSTDLRILSQKVDKINGRQGNDSREHGTITARVDALEEAQKKQEQRQDNTRNMVMGALVVWMLSIVSALGAWFLRVATVTNTIGSK